MPWTIALHGVDSRMPLSAGTRLGAYQIVAPLGAGGMGEVYRARDTRLGRDIALKVLPDAYSSSPERLARFEREARIVAGLNHPNIVTLHSIEEADGTRFLTMELVEGRDLSDLVKPGGLPFAQVLDLAIPLVDALVAAHGKGVVHRDLKPANVMVTDDGRVKVLDFGLARHDPAGEQVPSGIAQAGPPLSMSGMVSGTAPYMGPEQIAGGDVDRRTDLFALGVLLFELTVGRRPFDGRTFWAVATAIMHDAPPSLESIRPDVPAELARIVARCLEKEPDARYSSANDVADELRALRHRLEHRTTSPAAGGGTASVASIAVLPFANRSASADDEFFSDGLADELLSLLSRIRGLSVSARVSSFQFRGKNVPIAEIGRALNVATLLDGSVRRSGNRVRISVQLVKVSDGYPLWSERYDRLLDDIFAVQDDIARSVVKALRATLLGEAPDSDASGRAQADVDRAAKGRSTDPEAHRLYLLARHFMDQLNRDATARAIACLEQALERDPDFALAWAELSVGYVREAGFQRIPQKEAYERGRDAVERSLALEPELADAHVQIAWIRIFYDWDWPGAEAALARARELAPGSAPVLRLSGVLAEVMGRFDEAIGFLRQALEHDPLSAAASNSLGLTLLAAEDLTGAQQAFARALELAPQRIRTRATLALTVLGLGRPEDALAEARREPDEGSRLWATALIHHAMGDHAKSEAALRDLVERHADTYALQVAEICAAAGDTDAAFDWLDRAHATRDPGLVRMRFSPALRPLHSDPRWTTFLARMRFH